MTLLQLNTSLFSSGGQSTRLADQFVAAYRARHPAAQLIVRDFAQEGVPHLTAETLQAFATNPEQRTPQQAAAVAYSDLLIDELKRADVIVIGLPTYNFGVPSMLGAYFDHVARAGTTFRVTERGVQGLLTGKKVYVFATRGGHLAGTARDASTPHVREILRFMGMHDVEFVYAEGLSLGDATREAGLTAAQARIEQLMAGGAALAA
jgi:FMN-dependent NADH-azoreductase